MKPRPADPFTLDETASRLLRVGRRITATGVSALIAGERLRQLRGGPLAAVRRERALLLRDLLEQMVRVHGIDLVISGALPFGAALLASNHVSYLDPIVIGSALPCVPISKLDVLAWPLIGTLARELGVLFVARGDGHSGMRVMRGAARAFADRLPVLNFPEGTTTTGDTVLPFQLGLFGLALRIGVPVVPVSLSYLPLDAAWIGQASFLPHYLRIVGEDRVRVRLHFGTALESAAHRSAFDLARAARTRVMEGLRENDAAAVGS